mgnify:FL=1
MESLLLVGPAEIKFPFELHPPVPNRPFEVCSVIFMFETLCSRTKGASLSLNSTVFRGFRARDLATPSSHTSNHVII